MAFTTTDELVGRRVVIYTAPGDEEEATVIGVDTRGTLLRVRTDDGDILVGNQWDEID